MSAQLSDELISKLLDGAVGTIGAESPIIRLGDHYYTKYDEIRISNNLIEFVFKGNVVASLKSQFGCKDNLTISQLEGRMKTSIT